MKRRAPFKLPEFSLDLSEMEANPFESDVPAPITFSPPPVFEKPAPVARRAPVASPTPNAPFVPGGTIAPAPLKLPPGVVNTSVWSGKGTHVTDGLDLNHGQRTAIDIMAKPGTAVAAPADGVVERWGSAQGGDSMYFRDSRGKLWWLGHIDSRYSLKPGTRVRAGQILSRISADHPAPHLHLDREL